MRTTKKPTLVLIMAIFGIFALSLTACDKFKYQESIYHQKFSYVGIIDGKTVFLDNDNGKVIYVGNNRIVSSIDLNSNTNEINTTKKFKTDFSSYPPYLGEEIIHRFMLSTRFYNNQMLYELNIETENTKKDDKIIVNRPKIIEKKIKIIFIDKDGFELESLTLQISLTYRRLSYYVNTPQGRMPITFENYMEINDIKIEGID